MVQSKPFDQDEVALHLSCGSIPEQLEALRRLNDEFKGHVFCYLKKNFPGFDAETLKACYGDAIADLCAALSAYHRNPSTSDFDLDKPFLPYLKTIAARRAVDRCRRESVQSKAIRVVEGILRAGIGDAATQGPGLLESEEFKNSVRQGVARLPPSPRKVWGAYIEYLLEFEEFPSDDQLRDYVSRLTGTPWTMAAVKGGKRNGKQSLREFLTSRGYAFDW